MPQLYSAVNDNIVTMIQGEIGDKGRSIETLQKAVMLVQDHEDTVTHIHRHIQTLTHMYIINTTDVLLLN